MSIYKPKNSPYWHYDFKRQGLRFYGSTGETSRARAKQVEASLKEQARSRYRPGLKQMTLNEAMGMYYEEVSRWQPSAKTTQYQALNLIRLIGRDVFCSDITDSVIAEFSARRRGERHSKYSDLANAPLISPSTVNREIQLLKRVFRRLHDVHGVQVGRIDWSKHILREPDPPNRPLKRDEEDRFFEHLVPHARPIVEQAIITGLRKGNWFFDWSQVDLAGRSVVFKTKSKKPGGEYHVLPIGEDWFRILIQQGPQEAGPVFRYGPPCGCTTCKRRAGEPLKNIDRAIKAAFRRAGITGMRIHDLRHTVGTRLRASGHSRESVQKYLGHKDPKSTMRYDHYDPDKALMQGSLSRKIPELKGRKSAK